MGLAARRVTCKNDICMVYRMATPTFLNRQLMYRNAGAGRKGRAIEFVYTTYHNIECTIAAAIQICSCNPMAATTAQTHPTNNNLHTSTKRSTRSATPPRKPKTSKSRKNKNPSSADSWHLCHTCATGRHVRSRKTGSWGRDRHPSLTLG